MTKIPSVGVSLPAEMLTVFTKNVVETIVGIACSPEVGKIIDFSDGAYLCGPGGFHLSCM